MGPRLQMQSISLDWVATAMTMTVRRLSNSGDARDALIGLQLSGMLAKKAEK